MLWRAACVIRKITGGRWLFCRANADGGGLCAHAKGLEEARLKCMLLISSLERYEQPELRKDAQAWVRKMERRTEIVSGWVEVYKRESREPAEYAE